MAIPDFVHSIVDLLASQPFIAAAVLVIGAILLYFRPKPVLKVMVIFFIVVCLFWFASLLGGTTFNGLFHKDKMIHRSIE